VTAILLPDGVYVGLSEAAYFGQDRLGSTDLVLLHRDPASWWYASRHNPTRPERSHTPEMDFGSALHALVLEGEEAYAARAVVSPFDNFRTKEAQLWRDEQHINGRIVMTEDANLRVRHMAALILNHPELGEPLAKGLSEVSVLWTTDDGIRLRARFDKLLPLFTADLKTFGGDAKGRTTTAQCTGLVANRHMDLQRYLYATARARMADFIAAGQVKGASPAQVEWLTRVAAIPQERTSWCWIFYRRRDDERPFAPVVKPLIRPHDDVTYRTGEKKAALGIANYKAFVERFGFSVPWAVVEQTEEPEDHEFPPWLGDVPEPVTFPADEKEPA
jgi:hypothetical protein